MEAENYSLHAERIEVNESFPNIQYIIIGDHRRPLYERLVTIAKD